MLIQDMRRFLQSCLYKLNVPFLLIYFLVFSLSSRGFRTVIFFVNIMILLMFLLKIVLETQVLDWGICMSAGIVNYNGTCRKDSKKEFKC